MLTERPNQELSEAEKKKQKEYQEAIARESDKLAPTAKEHDKDKRLRDAKEKRRRDSIVGTWKNSVQRAVFQTDGTVEMYTKEGGKVNYNLTWKMAGDEIHVTVENGVIFIYRVLNNGSIQSYAAIDASGKRSSFIGSPLNKIK